MYQSKKRGRRRKESYRRKDRLIQTRVGERLERVLKAEAKKHRLTVSHLIRNVLEESFNLVDGVIDDVDTIVSSSMGLSHNIISDARRAVKSVRHGSNRRFHGYSGHDDLDNHLDIDGAEEPIASESHEQRGEPTPAIALEGERYKTSQNPLSHIYAWNRVVLNQSVSCSFCHQAIDKGEEGYAGLCDEPGYSRSWLCQSCMGKF